MLQGLAYIQRHQRIEGEETEFVQGRQALPEEIVSGGGVAAFRDVERGEQELQHQPEGRRLAIAQGQVA
ncbi:hypothetical protein D9M68_590820 [compost metagenome]